MSTEDEVSSHNSPGPLSAHFSPLTHTKTSSSSLCSAQGPVKIKRTRQRVDAGEPRNSYASIANFSSTRAAARAQAAAAVAALHSGREDVKRARVENIVYNMLQVSGPATATSATAAAIAAAAAANGLHSIADHMLNNTARGVPFSQLVSPNSKSDTDSMRHSTSPQNSSSSQMNGNVVNGSSPFASFIKGVQAQQQAQQASETSQSSSFNGNFSEASADSDMSHNNNSNSEGQIHPHPATVAASPVAANKNGKERDRENHSSKSGPTEEEDEDDVDDEEDVSQAEDETGEGENSVAKKAKASNCSNSNISNNSNCNNSRDSFFSQSAGVKKPIQVKVASASNELDDTEKQEQNNQQQQMHQNQSSQQAPGADNNSQSQSTTQPVQVNGCKKRKLYQPQQTTKVIRAAPGEEDEELDEDSIPLSPEDKEGTEGDEGELEEELEDEELVSDLSLSKKSASSSAAASPLKSASGQPAPTQSQVFSMRKRYVDIAPSDADADMDQRSSPASNAGSEQYFPPGERKGHSGPVRFTQHHQHSHSHPHSHSPASLEGLLNQLKAELLESIVKEIEKTFTELARSSGLKATAHDHESPKELTLLAQMLESKDHHHHHHHNRSSRHPNASALMSTASSGHKTPGESKQLPTVAAINGGGVGGSDRNGGNGTGNGGLIGGGGHRGGQASPFTLTTESAPAPRSVTAGNGTGHSNHHGVASGFPGSVGAGFKTPFSFLPAIAASQGATGSMMPPSLAQHFNSLASALSQRSSGGGGGNESGTATATRDTVSPCSPSPNGSYAEQEALSLVLTPKRKRTKSSTPSAPPPLIPNSLPTSVAIPNPSLHSDFFSGPAFPFTDPSSRLFFAGQHHPTLLNQSHGSNGPDHESERDCDRSPSVRETRESLLHHRSSVANGSDGTGHLTSLARETSKQQSVNNAAMAQAVTNALAAHHLSMLAAANRGSPDSLHGYNSSGIYPKIGSENGADGSEASINDSSPYDPSMPLTSTLTPMHLRKAKLMFFYVRYPSSAVLKMFFPDIKFNKNNTAQLVKWFSNFREFYYIQMEKYARQAVSEGITRAEDIEVTMDSELLRVLNLHYNRNNHIEVPEHFRFVVEQTLREFFKSIYTGKDSEQSWKKAIYKIIARLDDTVPEYFKSPTFLDQLE